MGRVLRGWPWTFGSHFYTYTKIKPKKFGSKSFGRNRGRYFYIADMDKCFNKCNLESWHMLKIVPGTLPFKFG